MCAVNPSRISKTFNEQALQYVVENIAEETSWLLEIVNYNIANMQYVCAGDLRALDTLTGVTNYLKAQKIDIQQLMQTLSIEDVKSHLVEIMCGRVSNLSDPSSSRRSTKQLLIQASWLANTSRTSRRSLSN
jgi:fatty acid synthase subunit beta